MANINLLSDPIFKAFSMSKVVKKKISKILSKITGISYKKIYCAEFQGGPLPKQNKNEKGKESDLIIHVSEEEKIIIEMNNCYRKDLFEEKTDYAFNYLTRSTKENGKFVKVILINIDNFNVFKVTDAIVTSNIQTDKLYIENKNYQSYHIILENMVNYMYNKDIDEEVVEFFEFIQMKSIKEMRKIFGGSEEYMKIIDKVEDIYNDPKYIGYYYTEDRQRMREESSKREGIEIGEARGEMRGLKIGEETGRMAEKGEIAQKLLKEGIPKSKVYEIVGLPIKKLGNIK